jgi:hypothetical protein
MSQTTGIDAAPPKTPTSPGVARGLTGCGGCGCLLGLASLVAGIVMVIVGETNSRLTELTPAGGAVLAFGVVIGFLATAVLIGGIVAIRKIDKAVTPADPPAGAEGPQPEGPQAPPTPRQK